MVFITKNETLNLGGNMWFKITKDTFSMVRKNYSKLILATALFLTGCSLTFPVPDETNQTILIIPVETRQTLRKFLFTLDVSIKNSANNEIVQHLIEPNPKMLFSYNTQLKPGKYKIVKMNQKAKPGFKLGGKQRPQRIREINEFELEKGKITIIDKMFLFQQPKPAKERKGKDMRNMNEAQRMQERAKQKTERKAEQKSMREQKVKSVEIVDLEETFKAKILEELKEVDNIDLWKMK